MRLPGKQNSIDELVREFKGETKPARRTPEELRVAFAGILDWYVNRLSEKDQAKLLTTLSDFDRICMRTGRPGAETERVALCMAILPRLGGENPKQARVLLLKTLRFIGRGESVETLERLLSDPDKEIREGARQALQNNPSAEAATALRAALDSARNANWRAALVDALGYRRDAGAVSVLSPLLKEKNRAVSTAAAAALGCIGGPEAVEALDKVRATAPRPLHNAVSEALLSCAERFLDAGEHQAAATIYTSLRDGRDESPRVYDAAARGLAIATGETSDHPDPGSPRTDRP